MSVIKPRLIACPNCKKQIEYSLNNKFRPFCSERCQLIDLGDWANETHRIPDNSPPTDDDLDQLN
jgi:uncharacterized protein